jgi:DNA-binding transcriptional regulator YiaG
VSPLTFRNVDADPTAPPDEWPMEAVLTAVERGALADWRRMAEAVREDPWGRTARALLEIADWEDQSGVARTLATIVRDERERLTLQGRRRHAQRIRALRKATGLTLKEFARRAGTSPTRLSAYENARVSPTTDVLGRIEAAAMREGAS